MLCPFTTANRLTLIHQMSLAVLSRAACASMSTTTTTTTTTRDRGDRYGMGPNRACTVLHSKFEVVGCRRETMFSMRTVPCSPGQYKDSADGGQCDECPNGKYQPNFAARSCRSCPRFGTTIPGATSIEDCSGNAGTFILTSNSSPVWATQGTGLALEVEWTGLQSPGNDPSSYNLYVTVIANCRLCGVKLAFHDADSPDRPTSLHPTRAISSRGCRFLCRCPGMRL